MDTLYCPFLSRINAWVGEHKSLITLPSFISGCVGDREYYYGITYCIAWDTGPLTVYCICWMESNIYDVYIVYVVRIYMFNNIGKHVIVLFFIALYKSFTSICVCI